MLLIFVVQNDMLQWIVSAVKARGGTPEDVARMVLFLEFAAIETTSDVFEPVPVVLRADHD